MRSELVVQLVRDELPLLVVGVENALHQFIVGAIQAVERFRQAVDLRIEGADLGRSVAFRARAIVAGLELRERGPRHPERLHRATDQKARHADRRERQQSALDRVLPRFLPDLIDLVPGIGDQDDRLRRAVPHRNRNDGCFGRRSDKGAKPPRRLGLPVRFAQKRGSKRRIADARAHMAQVLQTGDEVPDHLRLRRLGRKRERRCDEILGQPHRALRFRPRSPARPQNVMDRIGDEPESEQRRENEIDPIAQGD